MIELSQEDKDLLLEALHSSNNYIKPTVRLCSMRIASIIICDVIERLDKFNEMSNGQEKGSVLVFLPGLGEISEFIKFVYDSYDKLWI
jgi:HrpA-like RNA helicase